MYHLNIYLENSKVLPLYNLVQNRIGFMMYKLVNGLLPDIMSDLCIVNNDVHNHFTRQSHFLHTRKGRNHVSIQCFNNTGPRTTSELFSRNMYLNLTTPANSLHPSHILFISLQSYSVIILRDLTQECRKNL